jgi:hypothetical protein
MATPNRKQELNRERQRRFRDRRQQELQTSQLEAEMLRREVAVHRQVDELNVEVSSVAQRERKTLRRRQAAKRRRVGMLMRRYQRRHAADVTMTNAPNNSPISMISSRRGAR